MSTEQATHQADIWALISDNDDVAETVHPSDRLI